MAIIEEVADDKANEPPYTFKQTLQDLTISIPLPTNTRAKFVNAKIAGRSIEAALKSSPSQFLIKGELFNEIVVDESTWSVVDQNELVFNLEKANKSEWWPHVVTSDPKIDVTKIQPENSKLSDLDDETRAMVEKMMFDQKQKQQGLPDSDELKKRQTLDKFKQLHPELDFSKVDMSNV